MGQPVCRGLRPVSVDEGILEVEDNWVSADPMFQYTSLAWNSPRQVVVLQSLRLHLRCIQRVK